MREEYRKWAGMVTRSKYSEFTTSTVGSSHNQTRVRANPGVGGAGPEGGLGEAQSSRSFLSL